MFKGLTARRLYKSFGVKELKQHSSYEQCILSKLNTQSVKSSKGTVFTEDST
jgi:hypothetical protein